MCYQQFISFYCSAVSHLVVSIFCLLQWCCYSNVAYLPDKCSGVQLLGCLVNICLIKKNAKLFSQVAVPCYIPTSNVQYIKYQHSGWYLVVSPFFFFNHTETYIMVSHHGFNLHLPFSSWHWTFFPSILAIRISSSVKGLPMFFAHFLIGLFVFTVWF